MLYVKMDVVTTCTLRRRRNYADSVHVHCKNVRISTVPYTGRGAHCNVAGPRFIIPSIYGYKRIRNRFR